MVSVFCSQNGLKVQTTHSSWKSRRLAKPVCNTHHLRLSQFFRHQLGSVGDKRLGNLVRWHVGVEHENWHCVFWVWEQTLSTCASFHLLCVSIAPESSVGELLPLTHHVVCLLHRPNRKTGSCALRSLILSYFITHTVFIKSHILSVMVPHRGRHHPTAKILGCSVDVFIFKIIKLNSTVSVCAYGEVSPPQMLVIHV